MRTFLFLFGTLYLIGCSSNPDGIVKTLYVGPRQVDCMGVAPQKCLQVKENMEDDWRLHYGPIAGFNYEPGYLYELTIRETEVENPPADASSLSWELLEIIRKTKVHTASSQSASASGKQWVLTAYGEEGDLTLVSGETEITLVMDLEGDKISGRAACNNYFGTLVYGESAGEGVEISGIGSTKKSCPDPLMEMEKTFLSLLGEVKNFSFEEGVLTMITSDGKVLMFSSEE